MKNHQFMFRVLFTLFMLSWAIAVTIPSSAAELVVTRYFSGLWDQPKQESQGIMLQIIDQEEDGKKTGNSYKPDEVLCFFEGLGNHRLR